ncbi:MAG: hypothetical protein DBY17_02170 [Oscillospiraceae bacterium]|nr:MAG: hypothetical protein DBY17_02170 [Oscillospiraceae bacterium]
MFPCAAGFCPHTVLWVSPIAHLAAEFRTPRAEQVHMALGEGGLCLALSCVMCPCGNYDITGRM